VIPARFARAVRDAVATLTPHEREQLRGAVEQASADPWSWPRADTGDFDDDVRVITTPAAIVHYAVIPGPEPHLWIFTLTV